MRRASRNRPREFCTTSELDVLFVRASVLLASAAPLSPASTAATRPVGGRRPSARSCLYAGGPPPQKNAPAATPCRYCISLAAAGIGEAQAELALGGCIAVSEIGQHGLKVANGEAEPFGVRKLHDKGAQQLIATVHQLPRSSQGHAGGCCTTSELDVLSVRANVLLASAGRNVFTKGPPRRSAFCPPPKAWTLVVRGATGGPRQQDADGAVDENAYVTMHSAAECAPSGQRRRPCTSSRKCPRPSTGRSGWPQLQVRLLR